MEYTYCTFVYSSATRLLLQLREQFFVELLEVVLRDLVGWPADDQTFVVARARLRDDVEVDMVDLLVRKLAVVLYMVGM